MGDPDYEKAREAERLEQIEVYGRRAGRDLEESMAATRVRCGEKGEAQPYIGAPANWVRACSTWGAPSSISTTTTGGGERQMWVYRGRGYLYFDADMKLRTMQTQ